jgi:hypothetical protein
MSARMEQSVEQPRVQTELTPEVMAAIRHSVRGLLEENSHFQAASPELRKSIATNLVKISKRGAELLAEEQRLNAELAKRVPPERRRRSAALVQAQGAGEQLGLQAARNAGATITALKDAINFPQFVTSLISGVFQAVTHSTLSQLEALGDLLDNVSKSAEEFTDANVDDASAIAWALGKLPFLTSDGSGLTVRDGTDLEQQAGALKSALDASEDEVSSIDPGDLGTTLLPLVKRRMGKSRQANLATLVQLGLQRIVVDEGRLHASMELRVDTSSVSEEMKAQRDDLRVNAGASGSYGMGAWGASAYVDTSIGKVSSDTQFTKEQLESRAALRSSVDLAFRTEQIPLDRMADKDARVKLNLAARVPADVSSAGLITNNTPQLASPDFGAIPNIPSAPPRTTPPAPGSNQPDKKPAATDAKPAPDAAKSAAANPKTEGSDTKGKDAAADKAKMTPEDKAKTTPEDKAKTDATQKPKDTAVEKPKPLDASVAGGGGQ